MHIFIIASGEFSAWALNWACEEMMRYQVSFKLLHSLIPMEQVFRAADGSPDKFGKYIYAGSWAIRILVISIAYKAHWTPVKSPYGYQPCTPPEYNMDSLTSHDYLVDFVQGDIDFAEIYM